MSPATYSPLSHRTSRYLSHFWRKSKNDQKFVSRDTPSSPRVSARTARAHTFRDVHTEFWRGKNTSSRYKMCTCKIWCASTLFRAARRKCRGAHRARREMSQKVHHFFVGFEKHPKNTVFGRYAALLCLTLICFIFRK
jgi:hypothetical protein